MSPPKAKRRRGSKNRARPRPTSSTSGPRPRTRPATSRRKKAPKSSPSISSARNSGLRHREATKWPWRSGARREIASFWIASSAFGPLAMTPRTRVRSVRVVARGEELAPAFRADVALDERAPVWRLKVDADLAALLAVGVILILGLLLRRLVVGACGARQALRCRRGDSDRRAGKQSPARKRAWTLHRARVTHLATRDSWALLTCHSTMW